MELTRVTQVRPSFESKPVLPAYSLKTCLKRPFGRKCVADYWQVCGKLKFKISNITMEIAGKNVKDVIFGRQEMSKPLAARHQYSIIASHSAPQLTQHNRAQNSTY